MCFLAADDDEIPQELLLGKHQLNELGSESAKIKAMGISSRVIKINWIHYKYKYTQTLVGLLWIVTSIAASYAGVNNDICCSRSQQTSWWSYWTYWKRISRMGPSFPPWWTMWAPFSFLCLIFCAVVLHWHVIVKWCTANIHKVSMQKEWNK